MVKIQKIQKPNSEIAERLFKKKYYFTFLETSLFVIVQDEPSTECLYVHLQARSSQLPFFSSSP